MSETGGLSEVTDRGRHKGRITETLMESLWGLPRLTVRRASDVSLTVIGPLSTVRGLKHGVC